MIDMRRVMVAFMMLLLYPALAPAQPTTAPATRPRIQAIAPPGFTRVSIDGREFFLEPSDEAMLRVALDAAQPTTVPSTMPADLLEKITAGKTKLAKALASELAIADPREIQSHLDNKLIPLIVRLDELRPPIIYLVSSPDRIKQAVRGGWSDPRFYYNRAADDIELNLSLNLSLEEGDDMLVPLMYDPAAPAVQRGERIIHDIRALEGGVMQNVSLRAQQLTLEGLIDVISTKGLKPLSLKRDQEWFAVGVAGTLAATHGAELIGLDRARALDAIAASNPRNPVRPESIDLLHPRDPAEMRPEWLPAYTDAYRRRSIVAVRKLIDEAGAEAIAKVITAIRANPPADGAALVTLIQKATGVDLAGELRSH